MPARRAVSPCTTTYSTAYTAAVIVVFAAAAPARGAAQPPVRPAAARADTASPAGGRPRYTAADVQFMTAMIGHHAQAVTMSRMVDSHGASPSVRTLAARIINAQQDEIAIMQQWLRERGQPVPEPAATGAHAMAGMSHEGMGHDMPGMSTPATSTPGASMPGMLTAVQMAALDRARGREFDRLFLSGMIQHHRGAVGMVQTLFSTYGAGQDEAVFKFASDVNVDQTTEIARMQQMLAAVLFGES